MGSQVRLVTKLGDDHMAQMILRQLKDERVDVSGVVTKPDALTGFSYIIVEPTSQTRTCIFNPCEDFKMEEISINQVYHALYEKLITGRFSQRTFESSYLMESIAWWLPMLPKKLLLESSSSS